MPPIITLTTDFGTRDPYVASMKGVIARECPGAAIVDLTHEIAPQDIVEASLFIAEASRWFPDGTVHCVVVDPGVGTARLPIVARAGQHYFVCPDNGVLTYVARRAHIDEVHIITNPQFMLSPISATFHGRDMFAPAAACLARGVDIASAGGKLSAMSMLAIPQPQRDGDSGVIGIVVHVDRFGNAITNIRRADITTLGPVLVRISGVELEGIHETYSDVESGHALAVFGSSDALEIAVHRGSAAESYNLKRGARVEIRQA